ncbi:hypothetical protein Cgig2_020177 [Carnegiea gigantea]|uniref:Uncharacterized protein n=1 Tax=Carnegiea gigantea TaxID=171969 RepID=A0A9Q1QSC6_9CARY|nr:hypothetical protein Cgig2_020177 [Carnegiea gigantea]
MKLFKALGGSQLWLNHHDRALFPLPNRAKTTITNPSNLVYDDDVDGESGGESDGGGDNGSDDNVKDIPQGHGARRRAPVSPDVGPSGTAAAPTSGAMGIIMKLRSSSKRQREERSFAKEKDHTSMMMDEKLVFSFGSDYDLEEEMEVDSDDNVSLVEEKLVELDTGDCFRSREEKLAEGEGQGANNKCDKRKKASLVDG